MSFGVCIVSICPIRKEPSHKSEMVSQLLFGEFVEVLEKEKTFSRIRGLYDDYEGWIQSNQADEVTQETTQLQPLGYTYKHKSKAILKEEKLYLSVATPVFKELPAKNFTLVYDDPLIWTADNELRDDYIIKSIALLYINTPYLWGGKSSSGIDCSGFTQQVLKLLNIKIKRDAWQQAEQGQPVGFLQETICGDLAFFDNDEGRITHVGLMLTPETIIHSSGRVRIDKIDNMGIINSDTGERTHKLRTIRRFL
ncbi:C40 family peptidase [Foetidibacter luteolus]|uniref:C40 family peptidase n=1 Tax=Foetidibacter luteolus TaxID=2608880 RepID=UPI00129B6E2B|nr:C40 family peptidase [Foetidibacter luteolus]